MGFGYNPELFRFGERLDILNFFSWMKRINSEAPTSWEVFDASGYAIVNRTPQRKIRKLGEKPTAEQILDALVSEQDRPKRSELMQNCELRSQYFKRIINWMGLDIGYTDSRILFRNSSAYKESLTIALDVVDRLQKEKPDLVEMVNPSNANPASKLYLPLEIAEAIYLSDVSGVQAKFGPTTEQYFDQAILEAFDDLSLPYQTFRCTFGPRRPGYLSDRDVIWTQSPDGFIEDILQTDQEYRSFVSGYLCAFQKDGEALVESAKRIRNEIKLIGADLK